MNRAVGQDREILTYPLQKWTQTFLQKSICQGASTFDKLTFDETLCFAVAGYFFASSLNPSDFGTLFFEHLCDMPQIAAVLVFGAIALASCASCVAFQFPISSGGARFFPSDSIGGRPRFQRLPPPARLTAAAVTGAREEERTRILLVSKIVQQCVPSRSAQAVVW